MESIINEQICTNPRRTWASRRAQQSESKREQQFYRFASHHHSTAVRSILMLTRYYGPFREMAASDPAFCDIRNPQAREHHKPTSCPDKTLTAFCQLGALRMNARRALIFFFDVNHAYILAEATRTLSLADDATHDPNDQLWIGHSVIPRDVACCETTVNLPSFSATTAAQQDCRESVFVVNDLTKHPDLSNQPYVTGYPGGRFYAGVPITTASGINIGAYCVLDDKPRNGILQKDIVFMRDMAQTVMTHLEAVRALSERRCNDQMVTGLGEFLRGPSILTPEATASGSVPEPKSSTNSSAIWEVHEVIPDALVDITRSPQPESQDSVKRDYFDSGAILSRPEDPSGLVLAPGESAEMKAGNERTTPPGCLQGQLFRDLQSQARSQLPSESSSDASQKVRPSRSLFAKRTSHNKERSVYQRAAEIMCQSLRLDGVAFLDASVRIFGGLAVSGDTSTGDDSDDSASLHSDYLTDEARVKDMKACKILGCAQAVRAEAVRMHSARPSRRITESFLRDVMRRNPKGRIWTFDEDLITRSDDGFSTYNASPTATTPNTVNFEASGLRTSARKGRLSDGEKLQLAFPCVRCIAIYGIWDYARRRWSVGGLYWTYDPLRVLSVESEMQFVATFCDVVTAETRRLEIVGSDKAKSDFISKISHELRSPLHGILRSSEILQEHRLDSMASTLVKQISSCGQCLLDIIDHLLDFANIYQAPLNKDVVKSSRTGRKLLPLVLDGSDNLQSTSNADVALDEVTEDVVASSVYSYHCGYSSKDDRRSQTLVIFDIDRTNGTEWRCQLAIGAWKRICVNLITNALEYTPSGYVLVSLEQRSKPGLHRRFDAVLRVTDSGKGMSKDFQTNYLFREFSQEDTLSNGLGIGMHMVSRLVRAMRGKIDVISEQGGMGTCVTVTIPLERQQKHSVPEVKSSISPPTLAKSLTVGIVAQVHKEPRTREDRATAAAWAMAITSIESNLAYLGLQPSKCSWDDTTSCNLRVVMENDWQACLHSIQRAKTTNDSFSPPPVLVVYNNATRILNNSWERNSFGVRLVVEYIALPCGITQLVRAITCVLKLHEELEEKNITRGLRVSAADNASQNLRTCLKDCVTQLSISAVLVSINTAGHGSNVIESSSPWQDVQAAQSNTLDATPSTRTSRSEAKSEYAVKTRPFESTPLSSTSMSGMISAPISPSLLLVDDNSINLMLLATFARKQRYRHVTAADGKLAVDIFVTAHRTSLSSANSSSASAVPTTAGVPTVILMDINMPIMDGYEAAQRIRAYEKKHRMIPSKIIAVTALQSEAARSEALGSGFNMFLTKPLDLKSLAKFIKEL